MPPESAPASHRILNLVLYQAGWFACVLGAAHGHPIAGAALAFALTAVHVALSRDRFAELRLVLGAGLAGLVIDSANMHVGILRFEPSQTLLGGLLAPLWIVALWMQFATLLRFSLSWMSGRPWLAATLGAIGGPLAFVGGARLGAAALHPDLWPSIGTFAVVWATVVVVVVRVAGPPASYRLGRSARPGPSGR